MEELVVTTTMGIFAFLFTVGAYILTSIFMMQLFKKAKVALWKAWVPIVNMWTFLEIGGQKGWWYLVSIAGAIVGTIVMSIGAFATLISEDAITTPSTASYEVIESDGMRTYTATITHKSVKTEDGAQLAVVASSVMLGYLIMMVSAILAIVFESIAAYNIGLKLGWNGGMVVLFIFMPIIWLGMAGLGKAKYDNKKGQPSLAKKVA